MNKTGILAFVGLSLFLIAGAALAQAGGGINDEMFKAPSQLASAFHSGGKSWWGTISTLGMWVCAIAAVVLYFMGKPEYIRWAVIGFLLLAFGDKFAMWLLSLGGRELTMLPETGTALASLMMPLLPILST